MLETIGKYTIIFIISLAFALCEWMVKGNYLSTFFSQNAILLGGAIFAIHASSVGILIGMLFQIKEKAHFNFPKATKSIKNSFYEALTLLALILLSAILQSSYLIVSSINEHSICIKSGLCALQLAAIIGLLMIIFDTIKGILKAFEIPTNED